MSQSAVLVDPNLTTPCGQTPLRSVGGAENEFREAMLLTGLGKHLHALSEEPPSKETEDEHPERPPGRRTQEEGHGSGGFGHAGLGRTQAQRCRAPVLSINGSRQCQRMTLRVVPQLAARRRQRSLCVLQLRALRRESLLQLSQAALLGIAFLEETLHLTDSGGVPTLALTIRSLGSHAVAGRLCMFRGSLSSGGRVKRQTTGMPPEKAAEACPWLEPGRVYRTRDLAAWSTNAPRLARHLVEQGALVPLAQGLFVHPKRGRFGQVPPADEEVMRAFLGGAPFVFTGPERWNALGLGTTAVFAMPLVYITKRSGRFELGGRTFLLRRVAFPLDPPAEWFVVDLFEHAEQAGTSLADLTAGLRRALARGVFDPERLRKMADTYGTKAVRDAIHSALEAE